MKKTIMQSTIKVEGEYAVEIGDYAVIIGETDGYVYRKPFPEGWTVEENQTDGKIEVDEDLLDQAEMTGTSAATNAEDLRAITEGGGDPTQAVNEDGDGLWIVEQEAEEYDRQNPVAPQKIVVNASVSLDGKLGWEYFPGYYLFEDDKFYSPYSRPPISKDEIEPAEGEFTVDSYSYIDATSSAEKLGFVAEAEKLGVEGYID